MNEDTKQDMEEKNGKKVVLNYLKPEILLLHVNKNDITKSGAIRMYITSSIINNEANNREYYESETRIATLFQTTDTYVRKAVKGRFFKEGKNGEKRRKWCEVNTPLPRSELTGVKVEPRSELTGVKVERLDPGENGMVRPFPFGTDPGENGMVPQENNLKYEERIKGNVIEKKNSNTTHPFNSDSCMEELFSSDEDGNEMVELEVKEDSNSFQLEGDSHYHKKCVEDPQPPIAVPPLPQSEEERMERLNRLNRLFMITK